MNTRMLGVVVAALAGAVVLAAPQHQAIYAGFNHILTVDKESLTVSAFDYRRDLSPKTTCDLVGHPALLENAKLEDWLSLGALKGNSTDDIEFMYMGYELFLILDTKTGAYVTRRCSDFRPQLSMLPCEALATGKHEKLAAPNKLVWMGNNRVMIVAPTGRFSVHPFDADVHSGGDAFGFTFGPLFSGVLPSIDYEGAEFAYVQLPKNGGDLMLVHSLNSSVVKGLRFHGAANDASEWQIETVMAQKAPTNHRMAPLGENNVLFYSQHQHFLTWTVNADGEHGFLTEASFDSSFTQGAQCRFDNASACVDSPGCAWCPTSYTCHPYDHFHAIWCDAHPCRADPVVDMLRAGQAVIVPECIQNPDPESVHADLFDAIDEGYKKLPGNTRLADEYRNDIGEPANSEVAPIHPALDGVLGQPGKDLANPDDVIFENNQVAKGNVYLPPPPSAAAPCMDKDYDNSKAADVAAPALANWKMNVQPQSVKVFSVSPAGEATSAAQTENCNRQKNTTATVDITETSELSTTKAATKEDFVPRGGDAPSTQEVYLPASTATRHEEDLMNFDKTTYSNLNARWLNPAAEKNWTLAERKVSSEDIGFKPKEPIAALVPQQHTPQIHEADQSSANAADLMETGIHTVDLANADCTDTGGHDAAATTTFNSAMLNSAKDSFPITIEQQLEMAKEEIRHSDTSMPVSQVVEDTTKPLVLPVSDDQSKVMPAEPEPSSKILEKVVVKTDTADLWKAQ